MKPLSLLVLLILVSAASPAIALGERVANRVAEGVKDRIGERVKERIGERGESGGSDAPGAPAGGTSVETLSVDGSERTYLLHLPARGLNGGPVPLVLSFHGYSSNAVQQESVSSFSPLADKEGFIAVYPQGLGDQWHVFGRSDEDVVFVRALIDKLKATYPIDAKRIYTSGISNGSQMSMRLLCNMPGVIAAAGLVSGGYTEMCAGPERPPALFFHGTQDKLFPYEGRGPIMGVRDFVLAYAARPGCRLSKTGEIVFKEGDATGERWACGADAETVLYTLEGKGHSWPGSSMPANITSQSIDATATMWTFFEAHPLP